MSDSVNCLLPIKQELPDDFEISASNQNDSQNFNDFSEQLKLSADSCCSTQDISFDFNSRSVGTQTNSPMPMTDKQIQTTNDTGGFSMFIDDVRTLTEEQKQALLNLKKVDFRSNEMQVSIIFLILGNELS